MILTMPSLCVALCAAPLGVLADRWGRRPVLLLSLVAVHGIRHAADAASTACRPSSRAARIVGLGEAGILTVSNALMGDYFRDERRRYWLGLQVSIGPFVGSGYILLGGALATASWRGPPRVCARGDRAGRGVALDVRTHRSAECRQHASQATTEPFPGPATVLVGVTTILVSIVYFLQAVQHGRIFAELGVSTPARISLIVTLARAWGRCSAVLVQVEPAATGHGAAGVRPCPLRRRLRRHRTAPTTSSVSAS